MLNNVSIMGRLVRDPELRRTQSGIAVTTMRIAVDRDFKSQDGAKQADFFDVVAWRNTAEFVSRYFFKGRLIVVDGRLQTREWTDREGNKRTSVEIVADNVYFAENKRDNPNNNGDFNAGYGSAPGYGGSSGGYGSAPGYGGSSGGYGSASGYGNSSGGYGSGYGNSSGGYGSASGYGNSSGGYGSAPGYGGSSGGYGSASGFGSSYGGYGGSSGSGYASYDNAAPAGSPAPSGSEESSAPAPSADAAPADDPAPSGFAELADDDGDLPF